MNAKGRGLVGWDALSAGGFVACGVARGAAVLCGVRAADCYMMSKRLYGCPA